MRGNKTLLPLLLSFLIPFVVAVNFNLNLWYTFGTYLMDAGWNASLVTHCLPFQTQNPAVIDSQSYFRTHMMPILWLYSSLYRCMPGISQPIYASVLMGFWSGMLGLAGFLLAFRLTRRHVLACIVALLGALNGIALSVISFPHLEIAFAPLLLLFLGCLTQPRVPYLPAVSVFVLLLSVREDAGLHTFGILFMMTLHALVIRSNTSAIKYAIAGGAAFLCSAITITIQKTLFVAGDNALVRIYTGDPYYAHVTREFVETRLSYSLHNHAYIYLPWVILLSFGILRRHGLLVLGCLSVLPWFLFSFLAIAAPAGQLVAHYPFPLMIFLFWPSIAGYVRRPSKAHEFAFMQILACALSIVLFSKTDAVFDKRMVSKFDFAYMQYIAGTEDAMRWIETHSDQLGTFIVDDAAGSFLVNSIGRRNWRFAGKYKEREQANIDSIVYFRNSFLSEQYKTMAENPRFAYSYEFPESNVVLKSTKELQLSATLPMGGVDAPAVRP